MEGTDVHDDDDDDDDDEYVTADEEDAEDDCRADRDKEAEGPACNEEEDTKNEDGEGERGDDTDVEGHHDDNEDEDSVAPDEEVAEDERGEERFGEEEEDGCGDLYYSRAGPTNVIVNTVQHETYRKVDRETDILTKQILKCANITPLLCASGLTSSPLEDRTTHNVMATQSQGLPETPDHVMATQSQGLPETPDHVMATREQGLPETPDHVMAAQSQGLQATPDHVMETQSQGLQATPDHVMATQSQGLQATPDHVMATQSQGLPATPGHVMAAQSQGLQATPDNVMATKEQGLPATPGHVMAAQSQGLQATPDNVMATKEQGLPATPGHVMAAQSQGLQATPDHVMATKEQGLPAARDHVMATKEQGLQATRDNVMATKEHGLQAAIDQVMAKEGLHLLATKDNLTAPSLWDSATSDQTVAVQYNFIKVEQQVTAPKARNLTIGGTQNIGQPAPGQEDEGEAPLTAAQKIRKRTATRIETWTQDMVKTEALKKVTNKLDEGATWVTIKGSPGEGKSVIAYMALKDQHNKGRQVFQVESPSEFSEVTLTCSGPVIMLDDVLGDLDFSVAEWSRWRPVLCHILRTMEFNMGDIAERRKRVTVLFVGRDYILQSASPDLGRLKTYMFNDENTVNVLSERDVDEKIQIWNAVPELRDLDFDKERVKAICEIDCPYGFPNICKLFVTAYHHDNQISAEDFFNKPLDFLNQTMHKFLQDKTKRRLFRAMLKGNGKVTHRELDDGECQGYECIEAADHLIGSYLKREEGTYMFIHPSVHHSTASLLNRK
ncbi:uncharacterized protein [Haliotis cracherodii]|uniref:uncharacterized protein isoform X2 n=1 Tax=Haliotis cracherodii TaxID=6455 RepID=UPI0039E9A95C